jgi:hypothetical protein
MSTNTAIRCVTAAFLPTYSPYHARHILEAWAAGCGRPAIGKVAKTSRGAAFEMRSRDQPWNRGRSPAASGAVDAMCRVKESRALAVQRGPSYRAVCGVRSRGRSPCGTCLARIDSSRPCLAQALAVELIQCAEERTVNINNRYLSLSLLLEGTPMIAKVHKHWQ